MRRRSLFVRSGVAVALLTAAVGLSFAANVPASADQGASFTAVLAPTPQPPPSTIDPTGAGPIVKVPPVRHVTAHSHGRTVKVAPNTGLIDATGDGQFVQIDWKGFPAREGVYVRECVRNATDPTTQCSRSGTYSICGANCPGIAYLGTSDKTGSGSGVSQVAIGYLNTLVPTFDPVDGLTFVCDYQNPCSLMVMTIPNDLSTGVEVPLSFAKPLVACPPGARLVDGAGNGAAFRYFLAMSIKLCSGDRKLLPRYRLETGPAAINDMAAHLAEYAVTSTPISDTAKQAFDAGGETVGYAPVSASGLVLAFRMTDPVTGRPIRSITLTPSIIAKIFTGTIPSWGDKEILKLNPSVHFPQQMLVFGRGDACDETLEFTSWLWKNARADWLAGGRKTGLHPNPFAGGPTSIFPSVGDKYVHLVTGAASMVKAVALNYFDVSDPTINGFLGYVDSSLAAQYQLATVSIRYPNGKTVRATPKTFTDGVAAMTPDADGFLLPALGAHDASTWPMTTVSYAVVPRNASGWDAPPEASVLHGIKGLLEFVAGPGQHLANEGYVPLSKDLRRQTLDAAAHLGHAPPQQTQTPTPPPSVPTTPPTTPPTVQPAAPPTVSLPSAGSIGPGTSSGSPAPVVVVAAAPPPTAERLAVSGSRKVLPMLAIIGVVAALLGAYFALFPMIKPAFARVAGAVPRPRRRSGGGSS